MVLGLFLLEPFSMVVLVDGVEHPIVFPPDCCFRLFIVVGITIVIIAVDIGKLIIVVSITIFIVVIIVYGLCWVKVFRRADRVFVLLR